MIVDLILRIAFLGLVPWLVSVHGAAPVAAAGHRPEAALTVAAVGDIMLGTDYPEPDLPPEDGRGLLDPAREFFRRADLSFGNLEGVLCDGGRCAKDIGSPHIFAFRMPARFALRLQEARLQVVSLANNHCRDFGPEGLWATKRALREAGVKFSSQDGEVAEWHLRGLKVGLLAVSFGPPPRSISQPKALLEEIGELACRYDILVLSVHGGREGGSALRTRNETEYFLGENRGNLVSFAREAISRGADLVLGHGPHVPRALEVHQGRLIAYSLGNFCTYKGMNLEGERGYAPLLWVELGQEGQFLRGRIHSFIQRRPGGPQADPLRRAARLMQTLSLEDFPFSAPLITDTGEILPPPESGTPLRNMGVTP